MKPPALCTAYDQITDRGCRYFTGHGGKHNHDATLERFLRQQLDEMTRALAEALDMFDSAWCPEHGHAPGPEVLAHAEELRKLVMP